MGPTTLRAIGPSLIIISIATLTPAPDRC